MAQNKSINFPKPAASSDWREWAEAFAQVIQKNYGPADNAPRIGQMILYHESENPPQGVLPSGAQFDPKIYPSLARQLKSNVTPTTVAPAGYKIGFVAG